jgi:ABC-type sugar transport system substrate-binding protein
MDVSATSRFADPRRAVLRCLAAVFLLLSTAFCHAADPVRVTFINPAAEGNAFWDQVTGFMQAVARDLGVQLDVRYANNNRYAAAGLAIEALRLRPRPDCLVYIYQVDQGLDILSAAEKAKVYSFVLNTDVNADDRPLVGRPREKFKYWIGHMLPDDVAAGRELATQLVDAAKARGRIGKDGRIHAVALYGGRDSSAAIDRGEGLHQALQSRPDVTLHEAVYSNWDRQLANYHTKALLKRYRDVSVIWAASDSMALGALDSIEALGRKGGSDILLGGIDWTSDGIRAVQEGKLFATLGGHFMDGGWALVTIYDFVRGIDFASAGTTIRSRMQLITQENVQMLSPPLVHQQWNAYDFRQLSKAYNPQLHDYDFSLAALIRARRKP